MPRTDRTFSHLDVQRIYERHLTASERQQVRAFFRGILGDPPPDDGPAREVDSNELAELILERLVDRLNLHVPGFGTFLALISGIAGTIAQVVEEALGGPVDA